ncbi:TadE/TadG family type IV pilus assembly protein [Brevibacterium litoralis]|uniref:TadE/TadG family type IV pilus assembly protein n=1 Tax=Brevibacterium litoralis TaxID=3138935 RepID=UPI0032EC1B89
MTGSVRPSARLRGRPLRRRDRGNRPDRGATAIELAIAGPVLVILIFFCIQGGLFYYGKTIAVQSAREGLSQIRLFQDEAAYTAGKDGVLAYTESFAAQTGSAGLLAPEATATYREGDGTVTVRVTGSVITLVPGLDLTASAEATGQIERFEAER